jgi:hypothetical protein
MLFLREQADSFAECRHYIYRDGLLVEIEEASRAKPVSFAGGRAPSAKPPPGSSKASPASTTGWFATTV